MIARVSAWINTVNTTAFRVLVSIALAVEVINIVLAGIVFRDWEPKPMQYKVMIGVAAGILTMMGFDVLQFWTKRRTDAEYMTAKMSGPSAVTVEAPSTVSVQQDGSTAIREDVPPRDFIPAKEKGQL
jgi:hypothetical protein